MTPRLVGKSLAVFSLTMLIGSFVVALLFMEGLFLDLTALITLAIARSVIRGSSRAAKWALVFMAYYLVVGTCLICLSIIAPKMVNIIGRTLRPQQIVWAIPFLGVMVAWCGVNAVLLIKLMKTKACSQKTSPAH